MSAQQNYASIVTTFSSSYPLINSAKKMFICLPVRPSTAHHNRRSTGEKEGEENKMNKISVVDAVIIVGTSRLLC
jgi:hypothetical protein